MSIGRHIFRGDNVSVSLSGARAWVWPVTYTSSNAASKGFTCKRTGGFTLSYSTIYRSQTIHGTETCFYIDPSCIVSFTPNAGPIFQSYMDCSGNQNGATSGFISSITGPVSTDECWPGISDRAVLLWMFEGRHLVHICGGWEWRVETGKSTLRLTTMEVQRRCQKSRPFEHGHTSFFPHFRVS